MMRNFFELVYEYQLLKGKQDHLGVPLDERERARLVGLAQMLLGDAGPESGRRAMPRVPAPSRVEFTQPGGFEAGEIKNASGSGLAVATRRPPVVGTRVVVRVEDTRHSLEYFFPCRVIWRRLGPHSGMGVAYDGIPTRSSHFDGVDTGVWRRTMRLGEGPPDVQAA